MTPLKLKPIPPSSLELLIQPQTDTTYEHFEDARNNPFDHGTDGFSRVNAWWLADAALLAYWDERSARPIWRRAGLDLTFLSEQGVQCHVASDGRLAIVAFRGTQPNDWQDLLDIAMAAHIPYEYGGAVHRGFLGSLDRIWPRLKVVLEDLDRTGHRVWFAGHSLGAALATLAMDRFPAARGLYTIASPPVGNQRFARGFNRRHAGRSFRYANHRDIVVNLPKPLLVLFGGYSHVRERRYINGKGIISAGSTVAAWLSSLTVRKMTPSFIRGAGPTALFALPQRLVDHTPRRYAVYIWNDYATAQPLAAAGV